MFERERDGRSAPRLDKTRRSLVTVRLSSRCAAVAEYNLLCRVLQTTKQRTHLKSPLARASISLLAWVGSESTKSSASIDNSVRLCSKRHGHGGKGGSGRAMVFGHSTEGPVQLIKKKKL
jgi:hypothetical protein